MNRYDVWMLTPDDRLQRREAKRQLERERYAEERRLRLGDRRCVVCDVPLAEELDARRKTCSDECRRVRDNHIAREYHYKRSGGTPRSAPEYRQRMSAVRKQWWADDHQFKSRECRACGETFTPNSPPQRYCAAACKRQSVTAKRYGIEIAELRALLADHDGCCDICGAQKRGWARTTRRKDALVIDHCHVTGRVRGLLCGHCNTALGQFDDDPGRLRTAIAYLERLPVVDGATL